MAGGDRVAVFDSGANGEQAPSRVLTGPQTGIRHARRIAVGRGDTLYVLSGIEMTRIFSGPARPVLDVTVTVYAPLAGGDAMPVRTIEITRQGKSEGRATGFLSPSDMVVDSTGAVHVSFCAPSPAVAEYAPGTGGAVAPVRVLEPADAATFTGPAELTIGCWDGFRVVAKD